MKILITGCAGFIGMHLSNKLLEKYNVIGIDNINNYYDTNLKKKRLKILKRKKNFSFFKIDITNHKKLNLIFKKTKPKIVIHLASEVGVRNSSKRPRSYVNTNIMGFLNILESCKNQNIDKLFYASSSSVYGDNKKKFVEKLKTSNPLSIYAASKKGSEILAAAYSYLYNLPIIGLRFFTVYGPYGRPDMAMHEFTKKIISNKEIKLYNYGRNKRDFTFIDDVITGITSLLNKPSKKKIPFDIYNIGSNAPYKTTTIISFLEKIIGKKAITKKIQRQIGDVNYTSADLSKIKKLINYKTTNNLELNLNEYVKWFKKYYKI